MRERRRAPTREDAETMAIQAIGFLAADEDLFLRFVNLTGLSIEEIKGRMSDAALLGAVLDFILADERLLLAFAEAMDLPPEAPLAARRTLPGAPVDSW
jgi:hypothetical protein